MSTNENHETMTGPACPKCGEPVDVAREFFTKEPADGTYHFECRVCQKPFKSSMVWVSLPFGDWALQDFNAKYCD